MELPKYDAVFVVSDLHLGGLPGFQVFNQAKRLEKFILKLAGDEAESLALVVNGDIVDFLAEPNAEYFNAEAALDKLKRISKDDAFAPVFTALRKFVARSGRHLAIALGNHDVELALPELRYWLVNHLANGDDTTRGRITLAMDGTGWSCLVGNSRVLCVHGNEVDPWNVIDHRALLHISRSCQWGVPAPDWVPNGGTRLVVEVINGIKTDHPMVDLLKPEGRAVLPILAALDPSYVTKIARVLHSATQRTKDGLKTTAGWLGTECEEGSVPADEVDGMEELYREMSTTIAGQIAGQIDGQIDGRTNSAIHSEELLGRVISGRRGKAPTETPGEGELGFAVWKDYVLSLLNKVTPAEVLRMSLQRLLRDDRTFALNEADQCFRKLKAKVGRDVEFLVAGHTHLRRKVLRENEGVYFNTGTWIRLIRLIPSTLESREEFAKVLGVLQSGSLDDLDAAKQADDEALVQLLPTAAGIRRTDGTTKGALYNIDDQGTPCVVPNSEYP